jgi:hypothetical protein
MELHHVGSPNNFIEDGYRRFLPTFPNTFTVSSGNRYLYPRFSQPFN